VHDALLRIWSRERTFRPERGAFRAYLVVSVRNEAIARKRDAARHARIEEEAARTAPGTYEFNAGDPVERERVRGAVEALPPEQRAALALLYVGHLTHVEAAARLQIPVGTVKGRIRLALAKLQAALRERS
jgi:RNA polymerase sigma-70 factor (ECF subfamily)